MTWAEQFATLFGIGRMRFAPGTAASLVAAGLAWPIVLLLGHAALFALSIAAALFAVWVSGVYESECDREDPGDCVIDELAGQWLACAFAPLTLWGFALAFVFFRLFDIAKPWPVSAAEKLKSGTGIVADDLVAGLMAGILVMLIDQAGFL
jgi:phosphatidylglycerophosphatase A